MQFQIEILSLCLSYLWSLILFNNHSFRGINKRVHLKRSIGWDSRPICDFVSTLASLLTTFKSFFCVKGTKKLLIKLSRNPYFPRIFLVVYLLIRIINTSILECVCALELYNFLYLLDFVVLFNYICLNSSDNLMLLRTLILFLITAILEAAYTEVVFMFIGTLIHLLKIFSWKYSFDLFIIRVLHSLDLIVHRIIFVSLISQNNLPVVNFKACLHSINNLSNKIISFVY